MGQWPVPIAILLGASIVAGAVALRPTDFSQCVGVISASIYDSDLTVTRDPREVAVQAAKICAGYEEPPP